MINIITSSFCPYCSMAKKLISDLGFEYEEKILEFGSNELDEIINLTWMMTVPQIFAWEIKKENLLWGYSDILALNREGKLEGFLRNA